VARELAAGGCRVTGVDISAVQIARARQLVPSAVFACADAAAVTFPSASFDAVVCLYLLIHLPQAEQPGLLARVATWLRPGGWLLAVAGATAWTGTDPAWLGGSAPMWWSHPDAVTYRRWLGDAGLVLDREEYVPEDGSGHQLFWARRPDRHVP
jgi:SAM-dependent methyltransferase